jgi:hypothetical protein
MHAMEVNFARGSAVLCPTAGMPADWECYMERATAFFAGAAILAEREAPSIFALALLSAQALECALKAYLARVGKSRRELTAHDLRHDLIALWLEAQSRGLPLPPPNPLWVPVLGFIHAAPYELRYSGRGNVLAIPAAQPMTSELGALLEMVRQQI